MRNSIAAGAATTAISGQEYRGGFMPCGTVSVSAFGFAPVSVPVSVSVSVSVSVFLLLGIEFNRETTLYICAGSLTPFAKPTVSRGALGEICHGLSLLGA